MDIHSFVHQEPKNNGYDIVIILFFRTMSGLNID